MHAAAMPAAKAARQLHSTPPGSVGYFWGTFWYRLIVLGNPKKLAGDVGVVFDG